MHTEVQAKGDSRPCRSSQIKIQDHLQESQAATTGWHKTLCLLLLNKALTATNAVSHPGLLGAL